MKRIGSFIYAIIILAVLGFGIFAGHKVTAAYKDVEIVRLEAERDVARDEFADAIKERDFWRWTFKGLSEGNQLAGVDLKGRPSVGD